MTSPPDKPILRILTYMVPGQPLGLYHCYQHYLEEALGCHSYLIVESRWSGPGPDRTDPFSGNHADIDKPILRILTYMVPGQPLGLYHCYQHYLEEALGCHSYHLLETRWGGPGPGRDDPFTTDHADIVFLCSPCFLKQVAQGNTHIELLPAAPVFMHPLGDQRPVYFSEVIVRKDMASTCRTLHDLRGLRWAYNDEESLSGNFALRREMSRIFPGENGAAFFGQIVKSGSHHNSIQMVRESKVDFAAIDSLTLANWFQDHPEDRERFHVVGSIGPHPVPPIGVNTRLPVKLRAQIAQALLDMNTKPEWRERLAKHHVWGFKPVDHGMFEESDKISCIYNAS